MSKSNTPTNMQSPVRSSSCRGVAFEVQRRQEQFSTLTTLSLKPENAPEEPQPGISKRLSLRLWSNLSSFKVFSSSISKSLSKPSSHFCDLEPDESERSDDEEDEEEADGHLFVLKTLEEGQYHANGYEKEEEQATAPSQPPPSKPTTRKPRSRMTIMLLDQGLFTIYKRLFMVCFALNLTGLILAATGHFEYARNNATLFSIANIFVAILSRNEVFWWVIFWLAVKVFGRSWMPLRIKTLVTSFLQSPGGIHSSCGVSSLAWLIYALVLTLKHRDNTSPEIIGVASAILSLLFLTSLSAFPVLRHLHHNVFERVHRLAGWSALALLWVFLALSFSYDPTTKSYKNDLGRRLIRRQEFWFTAVITLLIILPWVTTRKVACKVSAPSSHASLVKFQGGVRPGVLGRISPSPLSEWHAFGIISDGKSEHMMLVGAVGDYTKYLAANPPSHLWVRQVHFVGMPYLVNMYDRILLVATGSGVCVYLSYLLQPCKANWCLLWVAKGIEQNFGKEILDIVNRHPKEKVIVHDTAVSGRPDVARMSVEAAKKWKAEVVFVTSNPEGSRDVIRASNQAGIPSFAPIWDS